jgi:hypothetical protein
MKITFELDDVEEGEKAERLLRTDEVFSILWDINEKLRSYEKYDTKKTRDEIIREIRERIWEDNILNLYN